MPSLICSGTHQNTEERSGNQGDPLVIFSVLHQMTSFNIVETIDIFLIFSRYLGHEISMLFKFLRLETRWDPPQTVVTLDITWDVAISYNWYAVILCLTQLEESSLWVLRSKSGRVTVLTFEKHKIAWQTNLPVTTLRWQGLKSQGQTQTPKVQPVAFLVAQINLQWIKL